MNTLSQSDLKTLLEKHAHPCISIFMPTHHRAGAEIQQDPVRLRNQIREAEHRLQKKDMSLEQIEDLLNPVQALIDNKELWEHPIDGLAILRSPDDLFTYQIPASLKEQVVIADHFYLKPLLPFLTEDVRFYVLALSQNAIRLLENTRNTVEEVELPESVPTSLDEALGYNQPDNQLQYHSSATDMTISKGGHRAAVFHGQGIGIDDTKNNLLRYFQQVDRGLHEILHDERVPLVLAGVEYLLPIYREANTYPHLLPSGILGNPDKLRAETLHEQAWFAVEAYLQQIQQNAIARCREYINTEHTSSNVSEIVPAAYYGRVESLFVAIDQEQWGTFEPDTHTIVLRQIPQPDDEELLDLAARQTLLHGGTVYAIDHTKMPVSTPVAAIYRY